ncbi:hypothetical protein MTR67_026479 [Solanum verrucosum]|uniref:Uncharacterized protein n=1 Tax=Solanum verrucosum TaxID=315347 RepID=A0AAF0R7T8_SOLVR|nr:hypothetical protein MTR67_026479 [Solanum verrucosum]
MKRGIAYFVAKSPNCQQVKVEHQKPRGMSQEMKIPIWKWEVINMDFITGLPRTHRQHDFIWVIVDRVTKSAHFLVVKTTYLVEDYAKLYINEIVRLHGVPLSIISDRGETTLTGPDSVHDATEMVQLIRERFKTAQSRQKSYADKCVGDPASIVPLESVVVKDSLTYEEVPVEILDRQNMTNQNNQQVPVPININGGSVAARIRDFVRMNPLEFLGSQVGEDPQNFIDDVKKIFGVMQVIVNFGVSPETLSEPLSVSIPVGDPVIARRVYINYSVIVSQKVTSEDLVELEMIDFEVILGMDWLHSCYALVDCRTRIVRFQFPDESILDWKGSSLVPMG